MNVAVGLPETKNPADMITAVRGMVTDDRRAFVNPPVKDGCGRRWRFLFLREAVKDKVALDYATRRFWDRRPARQRIADYYLVGIEEAAWREEQPEPTTARIERTTLVACPGLLNGLLPVRDFQDQLPRIQRRFGMNVVRADAHPVRGCEANVADLVRALEKGQGRDPAGVEVPDTDAKPPGEVFLLGYSKGAPDILTMLVQKPQVSTRVRCIFTWAGAIGGSEVADKAALDYNRSRLEKDALAIARVGKGLMPPGIKLGKHRIPRLHEFDTACAIGDLTTRVRGTFLASHKDQLDALNIPMFYFRGATRISEVPVSQRDGFRLLSKFDPRNDMQVTSANAALPFPMATDLGILRAHHWDLAYPAFNKRHWLNNTFHPFPKEAALVAIVSLAAELGLIR